MLTEELKYFVSFPVLYDCKAFDVVLFCHDGEVAIGEALYAGSAWFVGDES